MATGAGDRMDGVMDDARTRSRSPHGAPGEERASAPDGTVNVHVLPEGSLPMPEATRLVPEAIPSSDNCRGFNGFRNGGSGKTPQSL